MLISLLRVLFTLAHVLWVLVAYGVHRLSGVSARIGDHIAEMYGRPAIRDFIESLGMSPRFVSHRLTLTHSAQVILPARTSPPSQPIPLPLIVSSPPPH